MGGHEGKNACPTGDGQGRPNSSQFADGHRAHLGRAAIHHAWQRMPTGGQPVGPLRGARQLAGQGVRQRCGRVCGRVWGSGAAGQRGSAPGPAKARRQARRCERVDRNKQCRHALGVLRSRDAWHPRFLCAAGVGCVGGGTSKRAGKSACSRTRNGLPAPRLPAAEPRLGGHCAWHLWRSWANASLVICLDAPRRAEKNPIATRPSATTSSLRLSCRWTPISARKVLALRKFCML